MIRKTETYYTCIRDEQDPDSYDEISIMQSNEKAVNSERVPVRVKIAIPDRWRNIDEMIGFYEWVVSELKNFKGSVQKQ